MLLLFKSLAVIAGILLIIYIYHQIRRKKDHYREGFQYTEPNNNADQGFINNTNSANVAYLKNIVDGLTAINIPVQLKDLKDKTDNNTSAIIALGHQIKSMASKVVGDRDLNSQEPLPQATGIDSNDAKRIRTAVE